MNNMNMFFSVLLGVFSIALLVGLFLVVPIVSLVWTHRPDLSVPDILRDAVREIKKTFIAEK